MKITRAILTGVLLWVLIFFEVSILMFGLRLDSSMISYNIIHYIAAGIFAFVSGLIYFKKGKKGWIEGLSLGIVWIAVGVILDILITVLLFTKDFSFFNNILLWFGYAEGLTIAIIVGALKK